MNPQELGLLIQRVENHETQGLEPKLVEEIRRHIARVDGAAPVGTR